jgi:hypothetical protein
VVNKKYSENFNQSITFLNLLSNYRRPLDISTAGRSAPDRKSEICSAEAAPAGQPAVTSPHPNSKKEC